MKTHEQVEPAARPGEAKMPSGYCFEYTGCTGDWRYGSSELWDTEIYTPTGGEQYAGLRRIDGTSCAVFACPDGVFRAVNVVNVG